ncbi:endoglucanase [Lachnospiraceae bacterium C7]|nr:endoglucanase [Lachnospiraceae bacterium C7]
MTQFKSKKIAKLGMYIATLVLGCLLACSCGVGGTNKDVQGAGSTEKSNGGKSSIYAELKANNGWQSGERTYTQYAMAIHNDSDKEVTNWSVDLKKNGSKVEQNWNSNIKESGDVYEVTPLSYNNKIASKNAQQDIGIIASAASKDRMEIKSVTVKYSDGTTETVNGAGQKTDKKDDSKKDDSKKEEPKKDDSKKEEPKKDDSKKDDSKKDDSQKQEKTTVPTGRLHVQGTKLVDSKGKVVQLKGVSSHGIAWFPEFVNADALKTLKNDWNANVFRIAMYTNEYNGYCSGGNKEYLKNLVDQGVKYATDNGMYVIIDWHILSDGNPNINKGEALKFFDEMSRKYANHENVLYEICNEPQGSDWNSVIKPYATDVVKTIRANDKNAVILVGTNTWSQDVDQVIGNQLDDKNVMYVLHFYASTHRDDLRNKMQRAIDAGVPVFVSECSITDASGNGGIDYDSANKWLSLLNKNDVSFVAWSLCNKNESSALIKPSCNKKSGWTDDDLSDTGKWFKKAISE